MKSKDFRIFFLCKNVCKFFYVKIVNFWSCSLCLVRAGEAVQGPLVTVVKQIKQDPLPPSSVLNMYTTLNRTANDEELHLLCARNQCSKKQCSGLFRQAKAVCCSHQQLFCVLQIRNTAINHALCESISYNRPSHLDFSNKGLQSLVFHKCSPTIYTPFYGLE